MAIIEHRDGVSFIGEPPEGGDGDIASMQSDQWTDGNGHDQTTTSAYLKLHTTSQIEPLEPIVDN